MTRPGVVVLWSNTRPLLRTHALVDGSLILGRSLFADLADDRISHHHAELRQTPEGLRLADLQSRNGTWVDQHRLLTPRYLTLPALIRCGRTLLLVVEDLAPYEDRTLLDRHRLVVGATLHEPCNQLDRAILDEDSVVLVGPRWVTRTLGRAYLRARGDTLEIDAERMTEPLDDVLDPVLAAGMRTVLIEQPEQLSTENRLALRTWLETDLRFVTCVRREADLDPLPPEIRRWLAPVTIRITEPRYDELPSVVHTAVVRAKLGIELHATAIAELLEASRVYGEDELLEELGIRLRRAAEAGETQLRGDGLLTHQLLHRPWRFTVCWSQEL